MSENQAFLELLQQQFGRVHALSAPQVNQLSQHYELLLRWNRVLNLTAIRKPDEVVIRHYCESLFLGMHLPPSVSILDVGSGAGFPGIPIAVLRPDSRIVLAESHQRKAVFLREATRAYPNVRVAAQRAEQLGEPFDWVVSRAVRWVQVLPLVRQSVALLLGEEDASAASNQPGFKWQQPLALPWGQRTVLLCGQRST